MLAFFLICVAPATARADGFLDHMRNVDLNDYALGVAYSTGQNPYLGSDNSTILFPYLSSFRHSAFTDNWLFIRGENAGFRFIAGDWELGLIGRVQTLGQGAAVNDELLGIEDRNWAVEAGPLIGFRRWPVHAQFRTYWEMPNKHSGFSSELELSWPRDFGVGYLVPAVRVAYLSPEYSDYYFGVSDSEAGVGRPAYQAGSAMNIWAGFSLGYEVAPRWMLKASLGLEHLDSAVTSSPIIDRDRLWSGTIGFAYNAGLFNARDYGASAAERPVEIRLGVFSSAISTTVRRNDSDGLPQPEVDLEDLLGAPDRRTILQADTNIRLGYYHRLQVGYFEVGRRSTRVIEQDLEYGDQAFPSGTGVETTIRSSLFRFGYSYSLIRDSQKEFGVTAGLSYFTFEARIRESGSDQAESLGAEAPLPVIGAFATIGLGEDWEVSADASAFALHFDRYDGFMSYLSVGLERRLGEFIAIGLGYDYFALGLRSKDEDLSGKFNLRHHGPRVYLGLSF